MGLLKSIRSRLAAALVALAAIVSVDSARAGCSQQLTPTDRIHGFGAITAKVSVASSSSSCHWTVINSNAWISILSGTSGTGDADVTYAISGNSSPNARVGFIQIGTENFMVTQTGVTCTYSIAPTNHDKCYGSTTGSVQVSTQSPCDWTIVNNNDWILITSGNTGTGSDKVFYTVLANNGLTSRTGVVFIAGQPFTIVQAPYPATCPVNKQLECGAIWDFDLPTLNSPDATIQSVSTVTNFQCGRTFTATRTWVITDRCGNQASCTQTVSITDTTPPLLMCLPNKSVECGAALSFDPPSAMDACDGTNVSIIVVGTETNSTCGHSFTATRTWRATDSCGNAATCSQTISSTDTTPPVVTCAANKSFECGTAWSFDPPTASDGCDGANVTISIVNTITNFDCGKTFTATRTWRAADACGNAATCSQTVTVSDTTAPALTCLPDKTVECGAAWSFDPPSANDGCDGTNVTIAVLNTVTNLGCGRSFTATRTWRAVDGCGNAATCSQTVSAMDVTPPVLTCKPDKLVECGASWSFDPPTASDGCDGTNVAIVIVNTVTNLGCGHSFTSTRTWRATDACGNATTCSQTVSAADTTAPTLSCLPDKNVECGSAWSFDRPTAVDGCDGTNVAIVIVNTVTNLGCGHSLTATRTWRATDACGNSTMCSQTVMAVDSTPPMLTCAPAKQVSCADAWTFDLPTAIDGCEGSNVTIVVMNTVTNGGCGSSMSATRTWRATDACGNASSCSQTIQVTNSVLLVQCPPNRVVPCDMQWTFDMPLVSGGCGFTITTANTTTNLLCGATYNATRTWFISDGCSSNTCTQLVEVKDQRPPSLVCPPDITVTNNNDVPHCPKTLTEFLLGGGDARDTCGNVHYRCMDSVFIPGDCGGVIERTHLVYDDCFNTNTCVQRITILGGTDVSLSVHAVGTNDICLGGTLTFCFTNALAGSASFTNFNYFWFLDNTNIAGATGPCLTITNLNPVDVGRYSVQIIGPCETVSQVLSLPGCGAPQPLILGIQFVPAGVRLTFRGTPSQEYQILRGTELGKPWTLVGIVSTLGNGMGEFIDMGGNQGTGRMYKLIMPPTP